MVTFWIERVADLPDPGLEPGLVLVVTDELRYGSCKLRPIGDFSEVEWKGLTDLDLVIERAGLYMGGSQYSCPDDTDPRVSRDIRAIEVLEVNGKRALVEVLQYRSGALFTPELRLDRLVALR